ncbi:hypothetical protein Aph02nite_77520 [Actinoplanes philippinensis]|uniref:Uncharacterized protein n=1 Tax=Actinoplanes philippinensis TaxID=35752 RepID=A0A1I2HHC5_9ACTN|nr:hypothetical protein [Actinoplanes philippinensis]GIE81802.1 hypothetical protein Aph02nite_77520 [Actinoplanes philippinensis]SFF28928.1 hypothetical protein SAMN05421541_108185 [Actinoplanes philippinensis]
MSIEQWRRRRAAGRITAGDGRELKPVRWWQLPFRALFYLPLTHPDGRQTVYAVDLPYRADTGSGKARAHLYRDGRRQAESKLPAAFPIEGGTIEVAVSAFGIKRCRYVTTAGVEHRLIPDPRTAEGRRARMDRDHPALSRTIGFLSVLILLAGVGLNVLQVAEPIARIPSIAERIGPYESPVHLPIWLNFTLAVAAVLASTERALRLRYGLLDQAGK